MLTTKTIPTLPTPQVQFHWSVLPLFLAWALADVVRYAWYAAGDRSPHWLTWLRYTAFIPLYPAGIFVGEMPIIAAAIPWIAKRGLWSISMPNEWNVAFSYAAFCRLGLFVLLPAAFFPPVRHLVDREEAQTGWREGQARVKKEWGG